MRMMHHHYPTTFSRCWSPVLFLLILLSIVTDISAQSSSCSTAQVLQPGNQVNGAVLTDYTTSDEFDELNTFPASDLQSGHWFTYKPSLTETRLVVIDIEASSEGDYPPDFAVFKGSCTSLTLEGVSSLDSLYFENEIDVVYFIYVFEENTLGPDAFFTYPYNIMIEEVEPPVNDKIENAVALTTDDLPFRGDFTTYGALSDFNTDGCGLEAESGVWFSYETSFAEESLALQLGGFENFLSYPDIGIQVATDDQFICVDIANGDSTGWVAEVGIRYLILVKWVDPANAFSFEFKLQSLGGTPVSPSPNGSVSNPPAASPNGSISNPPASSPNGSISDPPVASPVGAPTTLPSSDASTSVSSGLVFFALLFGVI